MEKWLEEMYEAWEEAEEAKKAYYKAMENVAIAQKVYIAKLDYYNALKIAYEQNKTTK